MADTLSYMTERQVSVLTNFSLSALRNWRFTRKGPVYTKPGGRAVRYSREDVIEFMESKKIKPREG